MMTNNSTKAARYRALLSKVKESYRPYSEDSNKELQLFWCDDCQEVNLWTYWQGRNRLDTKILLVGQDWGCPWDKRVKATLEQVRLSNQGLPYEYLYDNPSITDKRLTDLFREIGYDINVPCDDLFFTNFVLGYRNKGFTGGFRKSWAEDDTGYFCELANILEPKAILCLGRFTFESVLTSFGIRLRPGFGQYNRFIESERNPVPVTLENGQTAYVFALAHCGAWGTKNRNQGRAKDQDILEVQRNDWKRILPYL